MANKELDLTKYGIQGIGVIEIEGLAETINGQGVDAYPRNEVEQKHLRNILEQVMSYQSQMEATGGAQKILDQYDQDIQMRQEKIKDPFGFMVRERKRKAQAEGAPGFMAAMGEIKDMFPGGDSFEPGTIKEGLLNFAARKLTSDDPKATMGDMAVIGSDVAAMSVLAKAPFGQRNMDNALISNAVKNSPAKVGGALALMNMGARAASNEAYDLINDITRYFQDLPPMTEEMKKDETLRNLYDIRNEFLWSGGATGLSNMWPSVKRYAVGPFLGVTKKASKDLMKQAERYGVDMNVFSATQSALVKGAGKVIGLFPFVATKARQAQNAQQIQIAASINKTLNNLSPIHLMNDAGMLADEAFRNNVKAFATTKATLYKRALNLADEVDDKFIPTKLLKEEAAKLIETLGIGKTDVSVGIPQAYGGVERKTFAEIMSRVPSLDSKEAFQSILPSFAYMEDAYLSGRQFEKLQTQLNDILEAAGEAGSAGSGISDTVRPFTETMTTMLNDFSNFKDLNDPAKNALRNKFANALNVANAFFTENADTLKSRTGLLMELTDRNITKSGAVANNQFLMPDQLANILLDDRSMMSPQAIKEMRQALGNVETVIDGKKVKVNAFDAIAKSVLDEKLRKSTRYISGEVMVQGGTVGTRSMTDTGKSILNVLPGVNMGSKEAATEFGSGSVGQAFKSSKANFDIPIMNIERMREMFGMNNDNAAKGMQEILGMDTWKELKNVLDLGEGIQQTSFGDVSEFVKRRGFLGGANAVTNLITGGMIASNPFGNVGLMLMARYSMSSMADPKFLKGVSTLMNPEIETLAKRNALIQLGRMRWDDVREADIPEEYKNDFDPGNPLDVMKFLMFSSNNNAFPGGERMTINTGPNGYATGFDVTKAESEPEFTKDGLEVGRVQEVESAGEAEVDPAMMEQLSGAAGEADAGFVDPFLDVDFSQTQQNIPAAGNTGSINPEQRLALAGGNLDEAIALGNRGQV